MAEFYLYFDDNGQILSVSGGKDATSTSRYAVFPEEEVIGFMNGNLSPANYQIIENRKTGKVKIEEKITNEIVIQTLDSKLYKIPALTNDNYDVKIIQDNLSLQFKLNEKKRQELLGNATDVTVNGATTLEFFVTAKDDPHFLKKYITINIADFIKQDINFEYKKDLEASIYTKRVFEDYTYDYN